ncbi:MAG: cell division ATP-binding protein FtsE [Pseudomonadota bacterium]|jgi:cell division transport system ATP-binding protein|nr:cell division ATP-binding protein FtsE [Pseudomonadota bacterium]
MIHFENVTKRYSEGRAALHNVSLELPSGELAFLTGHSGAGKSTLLKLIALIERPTRGQVFVDGRNIGRLAPRQVPQHRRKIGIVFQDNKLLEDRPAFDNVALPLVIAGFNRREIARRTRAALDQVGLLDKVGSAPRRLSAGEQQRVGIARAIASKPKLLIADEPTGNLDPELSLGIMNLFRRLNEVGVTMLIATHDLTLLEQLDARKIELADGEVIDRGNST